MIISTCCLRELMSEQYAHVKKNLSLSLYIYISRGTLAFYELMTICSLCSTFTELSYKLTLSSVQMYTQTQKTHPCDDNPALFDDEKKKKSILFTFNDK